MPRTWALGKQAYDADVNHWNSWPDGLIYMKKPENYPLQNYLQSVIIRRDLEKRILQFR